MISRSLKELHLAKDLKTPRVSIEIHAESLEAENHDLHQIASLALWVLAAKDTKLKATIYLYGTMSVNFHEQAWSEFLVIAGPEVVLNALYQAFSLPKVKMKGSEYIAPRQATPMFHIEDGHVWEPEDALNWYANSPVNEEKSSINSDTVSTSDAGEEDDDDWSGTIPNKSLQGDASEQASENSTTTDIIRIPEQPSRFRKARSDAKVSSIRKSIELIFGLPEGSVALCGPDGRALRGDASINTLRRRWSKEAT